MGYVEQILGDNERLVYRTHQHAVVLVERIAGWLFAFFVFLGVGLAWFLQEGDRTRVYLGIIVLGTLVLPAYLVLRTWRRSEQREDFWKQVWRSILVAVLILVVAVAMMFWSDFDPTGGVAVVLALFPLFELVRVLLDWLNERYLITNRRVMQIRGIVNKEVSDSALEKVNDVKMTQSIVGRILRYGTVEIITGSDIGVNFFRRISNPVRFKREMLNAKEQLHAPELGEGPARVSPAGAGTTPTLASSEASITDLLEELADLQRKGIISEEEFQAKKKELLARL